VTDTANLPLFRVTYALPSEPRVIGVVRAHDGTDAIARIEQIEHEMGRGPLIPDAYEVERVYTDFERFHGEQNVESGHHARGQ
jgi:hypothetical protein